MLDLTSQGREKLWRWANGELENIGDGTSGVQILLSQGHGLLASLRLEVH